MNRGMKWKLNFVGMMMICMVFAVSFPCCAEEKDGTSEGTKIEDSEARIHRDSAFIEMSDGDYAIPLDLEGGSGKSSVTSPAPLKIVDGTAVMTLIWSSTYYDYMIVGGKTYESINDEGYSTFEIPVISFDEPMIVIADTTAMSTPHEIEYKLILHSDEIMAGSETPQAAAKRVVYMVMAIIAVCILASFINKRKRYY